jgi:hypothetical protein
MENKLAIGPNVPAIRGNAIEVNHHKLKEIVKLAIQEAF